MYDHEPTACNAVECEPCLARERQESVIRLEATLLDLETSAEGAEGAWVDLSVTVDALDVRNLLDLLRD